MCSCFPGYAIMADGVSCEGECPPPPAVGPAHLSGPGAGEVFQGQTSLCW